MRFAGWLLGSVLVVGALAIGLTVADVSSPARTVFVLLFVLLGPAIAIGEVTVTSPIPEPQAALLLIGGGLALLVYHRVGSARRLM